MVSLDPGRGAVFHVVQALRRVSHIGRYLASPAGAHPTHADEQERLISGEFIYPTLEVVNGYMDSALDMPRHLLIVTPHVNYRGAFLLPLEHLRSFV